jgi:hypothetical protein
VFSLQASHAGPFAIPLNYLQPGIFLPKSPEFSSVETQTCNQEKFTGLEPGHMDSRINPAAARYSSLKPAKIGSRTSATLLEISE